MYLVYGMYHCLNVVTEAEGAAAALLIRAVEPLAGEDRMRRARLAWLAARARRCKAVAEAGVTMMGVGGVGR